jgi:hypothetical protein
MYVTVRRYSSARSLIDTISSRSEEVEGIISGVAGFIAYYGTHEGDTFTSVTVCSEKAGCDESTRLAGQWVKANVNPLPGAPDISGGETLLDF